MVMKLNKSEIDALLKWYQKNKRELPWRVEKPNPYHVWIAEIMSQQTRMTALIPYFVRFLKRFPTIQKLASAELDQVYQVWAGLGYYSRARMIYKAAKILENKIPSTYVEWLSVPGVGPYTAASITAQCFQGLEPVWDGNVIRVTSRLWLEKKPYENKFREKAKNELKKVLTRKNTSNLNQALMELGATVCVKETPRCVVCPFEKSCLANQIKKTHLYPPPKKKFLKKKIQANVWLLQNSKNEFFLLPRKARKGQKLWFEGLWDFPSELGGVKNPIQKWEGLRIKKPVFQIKHVITNHEIKLNVNLSNQNKVRIMSGKWFSLDELIYSMEHSENQKIPLATTAKKVLRQLLISQK